MHLINFYQFTPIANPHLLAEKLLSRAKSLHLKGTVLLATEGINGAFAGTAEHIDSILQYLSIEENISILSPLRTIYDYTIDIFTKMKVKVKNEIVRIGNTTINPLDLVGTYVDAQDWNTLISSPETIVIDTRNTYEYQVGRFSRAIDPNTRCFREFISYGKDLPYEKSRPIAMYCTGGIRCEKASSYLKAQGFSQIYHLKGGILTYFKKIPQEQSLFEGECFVFDNRVTVTQDMSRGTYVESDIPKHHKKSIHNTSE